MLKSELIARLNEIEGDPEVFISSDEEGNSYRRLYAADEDKYVEDGREINFVHPDDVAEYEEDGDILPVGIVVW